MTMSEEIIDPVVGKMYWVVNCDEDELEGVAAWLKEMPHTLVNGCKFMFLGWEQEGKLVARLLVGDRVFRTSYVAFSRGIVEEFSPKNFEIRKRDRELEEAKGFGND